MANAFELVGKLFLGKESEKFKPIEVKTSTKGWKSTRVRASLSNSTGFHNLELFEGLFENKENIIYCLGKDKVDGRFPKMQIKWNDRFKEDVVSKVAGFNKYKLSLQDDKKEFLAGIDFVEAFINVLNDEKYKDIKEALKIDENSKILLISTEGDTDPDNYRKIVWDGAHPYK